MIKNFTHLFQTAFAMALFGATSLNAQVTVFPWTENFEDSSPTRAQWTQIYEVNNMSWTYATAPSTGSFMTGSAPYEGSKMANYPATSHDFDKTKLVSPMLDLSQASAASVSFYYRNPFWDPDQNWLRVFYRTSATSAWVQLSEFHTNVITWTSSGTILLPNVSATYQIAIECETDYGYSTTVDLVVVNTTPLSSSEFNKLNISYYPNPARNVLNFQSARPVSLMEVYNLTGQRVLARTFESNEGQLEIANLPPGTYFVKAQNDVASDTFKLIKQ